MKALLALRGSMREVDREHLLSLGYDVTWVEDIESIRQIDSTGLRDYFAAAALPCVHADGVTIWAGRRCTSGEIFICNCRRPACRTHQIFNQQGVNMGRELRRVALDFNWPLEKVWVGFLNPHYARCKACDGGGSTVASDRLSDLVSLLMLSGDDARRGKCHPYFTEAPLHRSSGKVCGPDMTELTTALAGRAPSFMGHDACDRWGAVKKIIAAAGMPEDWGTCKSCGGEGIDPQNQAAYDAWEKTEPPAGSGYQIWETVSEGSPISPVFATPEELARWMAGKQWGGDTGSSYETWLKFITGPGWSPSMVMDSNGIRTGADAAF